MTKYSRSEEILDVAYKLISQKGYDATTMRDICKETGLTTAGLYYHFKNKDDLFNQVQQRLFGEFIGIFERKRDEKDHRKNLKEFIHDYGELILRNKDIAYVIMERSIARGEGKSAEESRNRRIQFVKKLREELSLVKDAGESDDEIDVVAAAFFLIAIINWMSLWFNPGGRMTKEDLLNSVSKFFIKGFLKER